MRGLYAATTVAPPTRVESTKTFPLAVLLDERGRGDAGSSAAARAAIARVAAAASSIGDAGRRSARTRGRPWRRSSSPRRSGRRPSSAWRTSRAAATAAPNGAALGRVEVEDEVGRCASGASAAHERRVVLDGPLVRRTTAACGGRRRARTRPPASTPPPRSTSSRTHSGVYLGTFFCMNGAWPGRTRITDSGRSCEDGEDPVGHRVEVVDEVPLGRVRRRRTAAGRGWSARPRRAPRPRRTWPRLAPGPGPGRALALLAGDPELVEAPLHLGGRGVDGRLG